MMMITLTTMMIMMMMRIMTMRMKMMNICYEITACHKISIPEAFSLEGLRVTICRTKELGPNSCYKQNLFVNISRYLKQESK